MTDLEITKALPGREKIATAIVDGRSRSNGYKGIDALEEVVNKRLPAALRADDKLAITRALFFGYSDPT